MWRYLCFSKSYHIQKLFRLNKWVLNVVAVIPEDYEPKLYDTYVVQEMEKMRNIRPSFNGRLGWVLGMPYTGLFYILLGGREPWTFNNKIEDWFRTDPAWKVSFFEANVIACVVLSRKFCSSRNSVFVSMFLMKNEYLLRLCITVG